MQEDDTTTPADRVSVPTPAPLTHWFGNACKGVRDDDTATSKIARVTCPTCREEMTTKPLGTRHEAHLLGRPYDRFSMTSGAHGAFTAYGTVQYDDHNFAAAITLVGPDDRGRSMRFDYREQLAAAVELLMSIQAQLDKGPTS